MTTPEPSPRFTAEHVRAVEADIRRLNALSGGEEHEIANMLDAFADLLEARAAKPEPSPLSEQDLKALEEYTRSLVCCVCDGPDADGDHDDDCQAPFWQKVSRAIAQARAARQSPWQPIETAPKKGTPFPCAFLGWWPSRFTVPQVTWWDEDRGLFCADDAYHPANRESQPTHWQPLPSPPAQDGGRRA